VIAGVISYMLLCVYVCGGGALGLCGIGYSDIFFLSFPLFSLFFGIFILGGGWCASRVLLCVRVYVK